MNAAKIIFYITVLLFTGVLFIQGEEKQNKEEILITGFEKNNILLWSSHPLSLADKYIIWGESQTFRSR